MDIEKGGKLLSLTAIKFRILVVLSIVLLILTSFYYLNHSNKAFSKGNQTFEPGTSIANISIGEKDMDEAQTLLQEKIDDWLDSTNIVFQYKDRELEASASSIYQFDLMESLRQAEQQTNNPVIVVLDDMFLKRFLNDLANEDIILKINEEELFEQVSSFNLQNRPQFTVNLHEYVYEHLIQEEVIAEVKKNIAENGSYFYLNQIVNSLDGTIIEPQETFSFLSILNQHAYDSPNGEMGIVASVLYEAITETNFEIVERHLSQTFPSHAKLGFESLITYPHHDLVVYPDFRTYKA